MAAALQAGNHWPEDPSGVRVLERHLQRLTPLVPLDAAKPATLVMLTQDGRVWRRLTENGDAIEQEFVVEVQRQHRPRTGCANSTMACITTAAHCRPAR